MAEANAPSDGWWVSIHGDPKHLQLTSELLGADVATLWKASDEGCWLGSAQFSEFGADRAHDVRASAEQLLNLARGAFHLQTGSHLNVGLGTLLQRCEGGKGQGTTAILPQGLIPNRPNLDQLQRWVSTSRRDNDVAHVLRVFSRGMDWHDLYHAFEVVLGRIGSQIWKQGWASEAEVDRFTQTANSRAALGIEARHGKAKVPPPKNAMTWDEADDLVRMIVWKWVNGLSRDPT